ncbi:LapA family protein [Jeotgalibacillus proteolyticus]|uniref:LapA family protein n=1 Tax=Jeotgalibacillus proteolyticus TaxID=2082395 RepID=UPI003CEB7E17
MKFQWVLILGIIFALLVAIFAVINVDPVTVNFGFAETEMPLILVILGSVLMGGLIIGSVGLFRLFVTQRKVKHLESENLKLNEQLAKAEENRTEPLPSRTDYRRTAPDGSGE